MKCSILTPRCVAWILAAAAITAVAAGLFAPSVLAASAALAKRPAVLYLAPAQGAGLGNSVAQRLHDAGIEVGEEPVGSSLTWDRVKNYNIIAVGNFGLSNGDKSLTVANRNVIVILNRFLEQRGGILFIPQTNEMDATLPPQSAWAVSLRLTPGFDKMMADPATSKTETVYDIAFSYAGTVSPSPVTEGVAGLWYPHPNIRIGDQSHTIPLYVSSDWQALVQTGDSTVTRTVPLCETQYTNGDPKSDTPGPATLVASRSVGIGRVVAIGINSDYLFASAPMANLEDLVLQQGVDGRPSDGQKLLVNAIR